MSYQHIVFSLADNIARITLNRPDRLNSFNADMHLELRNALTHTRDGGARVLLAGRGIATALMRTAEQLAVQRNRTLLVDLTLASGLAALGVYQRRRRAQQAVHRGQAHAQPRGQILGAGRRLAGQRGSELVTR